MRAILICILLLLTSCIHNTEKEYKSSKLELRQLVQETETQKTTHDYYFIIAGGYDSHENKITTVKVFAKVEGRFRLIEMPIEEIRISIDNKIKKPNIEIDQNILTKYAIKHNYIILQAKKELAVSQ